MLYLKGETNMAGTTSVDNCSICSSVTRKTHPEVTLVEYDGDNTVAVFSDDYRRTIPTFSFMRGALELAMLAVKKNKMEESYLYDVISLPVGKAISFENWAGFIVSDKLYDALIELRTANGLSYSDTVAFLYKNCE